MLGTTTDGLYRGPHITLSRDQIPARGQKLGGFDTASFVNFLGRAVAAIGEHLSPHDIAVAFYHGMCAPKFMSFVRVKGCVNAAEHHIGAAFACQFANFISPERVGSVDANTDNIASLNAG